jgi:hypothetical protein
LPRAKEFAAVVVYEGSMVAIVGGSLRELLRYDCRMVGYGRLRFTGTKGTELADENSK